MQMGYIEWTVPLTEASDMCLPLGSFPIISILLYQQPNKETMQHFAMYYFRKVLVHCDFDVLTIRDEGYV